MPTNALASLIIGLVLLGCFVIPLVVMTIKGWNTNRSQSIWSLCLAIALTAMSILFLLSSHKAVHSNPTPTTSTSLTSPHTVEYTLPEAMKTTVKAK